MTETAVRATLVDRYATGGLSRQYWGALAEGRLVIPFCHDCAKHFFFPRRWCPTCWSDRVELVDSDGVGEIFAISELHTAFQGISKEELPVPVVLVSLDEGVVIPGRLAKVCMPAVVGDRVQLTFAPDPEVELPLFRTIATVDLTASMGSTDGREGV